MEAHIVSSSGQALIVAKVLSVYPLNLYGHMVSQNNVGLHLLLCLRLFLFLFMG